MWIVFLPAGRQGRQTRRFLAGPDGVRPRTIFVPLTAAWLALGWRNAPPCGRGTRRGALLN